MVIRSNVAGADVSREALMKKLQQVALSPTCPTERNLQKDSVRLLAHVQDSSEKTLGEVTRNLGWRALGANFGAMGGLLGSMGVGVYASMGALVAASQSGCGPTGLFAIYLGGAVATSATAGYALLKGLQRARKLEALESTAAQFGEMMSPKPIALLTYNPGQTICMPTCSPACEPVTVKAGTAAS